MLNIKCKPSNLFIQGGEDKEGDGEAEDDPDALEEANVHGPEGRMLESI